ncbi:MAG: hypothetical protein ACJZ8O_03595 [Pirellulaceae bacterium]
MRDVWLKPNQRALTASVIMPLAIIVLAALMLTGVLGDVHWVIQGVTGGLALVSVFAVVVLVKWFYHPRLAYEEGMLLVNLNAGPALKVPIDLVEVFFAGQSNSHMPKTVQQSDSVTPESRTIVVRLAERATQYHSRTVMPRLGSWEQGYIVVRGTWCEPINREVIKSLNKQLVAAHRAIRGEQETVEESHD